MNNGFFGRGDGAGNAGFSYTMTIPEIPINLPLSVPLHIPVEGRTTEIVLAPFKIPAIPLDFPL
ncbi:PPE family domain protein [Mycobacterium kansasii]|nr:PPE family domain protein [Mycobacterium kansasii]